MSQLYYILVYINSLYWFKFWKLPLKTVCVIASWWWWPPLINGLVYCVSATELSVCIIYSWVCILSFGPSPWPCEGGVVGFWFYKWGNGDLGSLTDIIPQCCSQGAGWGRVGPVASGLLIATRVSFVTDWSDTSGRPAQFSKTQGPVRGDASQRNRMILYHENIHSHNFPAFR